jgi:hypothetical protein
MLDRARKSGGHQWPANGRSRSRPATGWEFLIVATKGFYCDGCQAFRLFDVVNTRNPTGDLYVRYRACSACGHRLITDEKPRRRPKPATR